MRLQSTDALLAMGVGIGLLVGWGLRRLEYVPASPVPTWIRKTLRVLLVVSTIVFVSASALVAAGRLLLDALRTAP